MKSKSSIRRGMVLAIMTACVSFNAGFVSAQSVQTIVDRTSILIGERVKYTVKGNFPEGGNTIAWFNVPDSIPHFDLLDKGQLENITFKDGSRGYEQTIMFTSFDSGRWTFPSFIVRSVAEKQQQPMTFYTDSVTINVLYSPSDSTDALRDIKPIIEVSIIDNTWYFIAAGILLLLLIAWLLWRYFSKRPKKPVMEPGSKLSPYEEAMQELSKLEREQPVDPAAIKIYHTRLTDILKRYLGRIQQKNLMNRTTGDLLILMTENNAGTDRISALATALRCNDAVKFAKYLPSGEESRDCLGRIKETIQAFQQSLQTKKT